MSQAIDDLALLIAKCMLREQAGFRQVIQKLRRAEGEGKPFDRLLSRLKDEIERSAARRALRDATRPVPSYPEDLPIAARRNEIAQAITQHQVVIVCGETGSGKTTQLPKICLELGRGVAGMIGHTQPRRIAARSVAARIASELQTPLGNLVGYQVRFNDALSEDTRLKVMTDGILLAETQRDRQLLAYDTLIIDEAHERSLNIDFLLGYLGQFLPQRPDLKVIVTSATIDPQRFSAHFGGAPVIEVSGRTFPVDLRHQPVRSEDDDDEEDPSILGAILAAVDELAAIDDGDMLIFLSGEREIRETQAALEKHAVAGPPVEIVPLYARLTSEEQQRVFEPHEGRRIVLATNVAETSLTVPGIRFVIDPGLARISRFSPQSRVQRLPIEPVSQASANQRAGRCGRIGPGVCIRLYSREDFESRPAFTDPEILRSNLASVILQMKALRLGHIERFPFIDPPRPSAVREGYQTLLELGAVDEHGQITKLGTDLSRLPMDPRLGRMILAASGEGSLREVLIIASALATQDPRVRPAESQGLADLAHAQFIDDRSDFLTLLKIWDFYHQNARDLSGNQLRKLCQRTFLSYIRLREWNDVHRQVQDLAREAGLKFNETPASYEDIHRALLSGLLGNIGARSEGGGPGEYKGVQNRRFHINPGSGLFRKGPRWVAAAEMAQTTRLYARTVARIQPEWVERYAGHLVKRVYTPPHWNAVSAHVEAFERVTLHGLPIIPKRRVHYGAVDPALAREVFIQAALVEGDYRAPAPFLEHNQALMEELKTVEAKRRRRDVLVETDLLYAFYDQRIPAEVFNGPLFEKWRRAEELRHPGAGALFMSREELLRHDAGGVTADQFPDVLNVNGMRLPLTYRLEPGSELDGVTLTIPVEAFNQVHEEQMQWLVPGLLEEKIAELIRTLPKEVRRNFVPAAAFATACARAAPFGRGSLLEAITEELDRLTGVTISPALWRPDDVPSHLRMNLNVVDAQGTTLAQGRDLHKVRSQLNGVRPPESPTLPAPEFDRDGITGWDFGELPRRIERTRAGIAVHAYPAIVDQGQSVSLRLMDSPDLARVTTRAGIRRLFVLALRDELDSQLEYAAHEGLSSFMEEFSNRFGAENLRRSVIDLIADRAFLGDAPDLGTAADFDERLNLGWSSLWSVTNDLGDVLGRIATAHQAVRASVHTLADNPHFAASVRDIRFQLDQLFPVGFPLNIPSQWLTHLPRFLNAIVVRIRRLAGAGQSGITRDQQRLDEVGAHWLRHQQRLAKHAQRRIIDPELEHYRWMIEELRVALFAPELKASTPVSSRRLDALWERVQP